MSPGRPRLHHQPFMLELLVQRQDGLLKMCARNIVAQSALMVRFDRFLATVMFHLEWADLAVVCTLFPCQPEERREIRFFAGARRGINPGVHLAAHFEFLLVFCSFFQFRLTSSRLGFSTFSGWPSHFITPGSLSYQLIDHAPLSGDALLIGSERGNLLHHLWLPLALAPRATGWDLTDERSQADHP